MADETQAIPTDAVARTWVATAPLAIQPYLRLARNVLPTAGALDFSPIEAIFAVNIGVQIVTVIVNAL